MKKTIQIIFCLFPILMGNAFAQGDLSTLEMQISSDFWECLDQFVEQNAQDQLYQIGNESVDRREIVKNIDELLELNRTLNVDLTIAELPLNVRYRILFLVKQVVLANELLGANKSGPFSIWLQAKGGKKTGKVTIPLDLPIHYIIGIEDGYPLWHIRQAFAERAILKFESNVPLNQFRTLFQSALIQSLHKRLANAEDYIVTRVMEDLLSQEGGFKDGVYMYMADLMKKLTIEGQTTEVVTNNFIRMIKTSVADVAAWAKLPIDIVGVPRGRTVWARQMKEEFAKLNEEKGFGEWTASKRMAFVLETLVKLK